MSDATKLQLIDIQKLQFSDKPAAERSMLAFLREHEDASIEMVELNPKPESLNSLCGFVSYAGGERYFFKTHVEESEQVSEYYNAESLAKAGYPVVTTKRVTHRVGKQIALYEIVTFPTFFDVIKSVEDKGIVGRNYDYYGGVKRAAALNSMQGDLDRKVMSIYRETLQEVDLATSARAPIHQLFSHRLASDGRVGLFYEGKEFELPDGAKISFDNLCRLDWEINGVTYDHTLGEIIEMSRQQLAPAAGPAVVGHGDAHNGNVFLDEANNNLYLFDPAFAGLHDPLLDLVKPLFHNVFARWMYFPEQVADEFTIEVNRTEESIIVKHTFVPSTLRIEFLRSKLQHVLKPLVAELASRGLLRSNWREYLHLALFCCPFLTVNLFAPYKANGTLAERYPASIRMLGLAVAMQVGSISYRGRSTYTVLLDELISAECGAR